MDRFGGRGSILQEAARIVTARFEMPRGLAASVESFDPITGHVDWSSGEITEGSPIHVGFGFGEYVPAEEKFYFYGFEVGGTQYIYGSRHSRSAPPKNSTLSDMVKSYALGVSEPLTLDALCFIATGVLGVHSEDFTAGSRVVGLNWSHFQSLIMHAVGVFENVLTINPEDGEPPPGEAAVTDFSIVKG